MACNPSVMATIIREGMDDYWRVVYSKSDEGLNPDELSWKREHERDMQRLNAKFEDWGRLFASK